MPGPVAPTAVSLEEADPLACRNLEDFNEQILPHCGSHWISSYLDWERISFTKISYVLTTQQTFSYLLEVQSPLLNHSMLWDKRGNGFLMLILFRALLLFDSYSWAFLHYYPHLIDRTLVTSAKKGSYQRNTDVQRVTDVQRYQPFQWQQDLE